MKIIIAASIFFVLFLNLSSLYLNRQCLSDICEGANYAEYNQLKLQSECESANALSFNAPKVSDEFIKGCEEYLK